MVQLIRVPRPKSVQWPRASKEASHSNKPVSEVVRPDRSPEFPQSGGGGRAGQEAGGPVANCHPSSRSDGSGTPSSRGCSEEGQRAGHPSESRRAKQFQSTEQIVVRAEGRLDEAEKAVVGITEKRDGLRAELVSSKERLARLRQDVSFGGDGHSVPQVDIPAEVVTELERLRSMVANLAQDRDLELKRLREQVAQLQGDSTPVERPRVRQRLDPVPYIPALIPAELAQWMEDRQADLQEGPQFGRHQSHFGVGFEVERGRRTVGGDERWHVAVTRQSLFGVRGVRLGRRYPGPRHKRRR